MECILHQHHLYQVHHSHFPPHPPPPPSLHVDPSLPFLVELGGEVVTDWILLPDHGDCRNGLEGGNEVQEYIVET